MLITGVDKCKIRWRVREMRWIVTLEIKSERYTELNFRLNHQNLVTSVKVKEEV